MSVAPVIIAGPADTTSPWKHSYCRNCSRSPTPAVTVSPQPPLSTYHHGYRYYQQCQQRQLRREARIALHRPQPPVCGEKEVFMALASPHPHNSQHCWTSDYGGISTASSAAWGAGQGLACDSDLHTALGVVKRPLPPTPIPLPFPSYMPLLPHLTSDRTHSPWCCLPVCLIHVASWCPDLCLAPCKFNKCLWVGERKNGC